PTTPSRFFDLPSTQAAEHQLAILDLGLIAIERARGRAGLHLSLNRKDRTMTRANELMAARVPVIGTAQMRTLRPECGHGARLRFHHPSAALLAEDSPTIDSGPPEKQLDGHV